MTMHACFTGRVISVDMSWHFHDAVVEIEVARIKPNGKLADPKLMTYKQVRTMLDDAAQAKALLDTRLREVQQREAISVGAKVDLWIDELDTNVRAVITDIGKRPLSVCCCVRVRVCAVRCLAL